MLLQVCLFVHLEKKAIFWLHSTKFGMLSGLHVYLGPQNYEVRTQQRQRSEWMGASLHQWADKDCEWVCRCLQWFFRPKNPLDILDNCFYFILLIKKVAFRGTHRHSHTNILILCVTLGVRWNWCLVWKHIYVWLDREYRVLYSLRAALEDRFTSC